MVVILETLVDQKNRKKPFDCLPIEQPLFIIQ